LFGGPGKTSTRGGVGLFYDLFGQSIMRIADQTALGFSTQLRNQGTQTSATVPRYVSLTEVPAGLLPAAPTGGFPQIAPSVYATASGVDDTIQGPYTINTNFSIGRDLPGSIHVEVSYIGRLSRKSLIGQDVGIYTNMTDPVSHQTYFQAANVMDNYVRAKAAVANVQAIPWFENLFPGYAGSGLSATQNIYQKYWTANPNSDTTALQFIDASATNCNPCSIYGPDALYSSQYAALTAFRSIGRGEYHAFQLTTRKRFSNGIQFDLNYTLSKSMDLGSAREADGTSFRAVLSPWFPDQMHAVSDYDTRHLVSAFFVAELPFGQGHRFGGSNPVMDTLFGGWQLSGVWRQSSGLPVSVGNGSAWPTNWNNAGFATQVGSFVSGSVKNSSLGGPNLFPDPKAALSAFDFTYAGQSGSRNVVRGDGFFGIDTGLSKRFRMPYNENHSVQFRAEAFNVTNSVRFDVNQLTLRVDNASSFGKYSGTLTTPRVMQFSLRYEF
jgi:hypothetical protein